MNFDVAPDPEKCRCNPTHVKVKDFELAPQIVSDALKLFPVF